MLSTCDFGDTNIDPTSLPDVDVRLILPAVQAQSARNIGSIGARVTGSIIQHFTGIDAQPEGYTSYLIDENALNSYWSTGLYSAAMRDCNIIIEKSDNGVAPHYSGIAKILMAFNLGIATSFWGDVPYSEAFKEDNFSPLYDGQEQIYESIQSLLDESILDLSMNSGKMSPGDDDLIFDGNVELWKITARTLKARYYLHLSKRDAEAASKALNVINSGAELNEDNVPLFPFGNSQNEANPLAIFGEDRPNQLVLGDFIKSFMQNFKDPRIARYAVLKIDQYLLYERENRDLFWTQFDSALPLISHTEVLFIKSECHLRLGNEALAQDLLDQAISSNMQMLGIADVESKGYLDQLGDLSSLASFEDKLKMIIEQKYVALFSQGILETWVDFRRTGYPELIPASNASESFNPSKIIPRRYIYPISERNTNNENLQIAIGRQGGQLLDIDMWAFR